jgi:hypothetical protein
VEDFEKAILKYRSSNPSAIRFVGQHTLSKLTNIFNNRPDVFVTQWTAELQRRISDYTNGQLDAHIPVSYSIRSAANRITPDIATIVYENFVETHIDPLRNRLAENRVSVEVIEFFFNSVPV